MKPNAKLGPFTAGMNNRVEDYALTPQMLRNAVNVDLTATGRPRRRQGSINSLAGADVHSLWADGEQAYYIDGDALCATDANMTKSVIKSGLTPGLRASFAKVAGDVYWSNGVAIERITDAVSSPAGVPILNPVPAVTVSTGGSLPAGVYQVAFTAMTADGEESGSTWPQQVTVPEHGKIEVSGVVSGAYATNIYLTPVNGDVLMHAITLAPGVASYAFAVTPYYGRQLLTKGLQPMPAGQLVRYFNGRLLVAAGSLLCYSETYAPALHNPARGYIPFSARITMVEPCENGVFVSAGTQTYWLAGTDIEQSEVNPILPYGAVEGASGKSDRDQTVWWFSQQGLVIGAASGEAKNLQEAAVSVEPARSGAGLYREQNGVRQVVNSLFGTETSTAAATSFMEAEIVRKESML